jgi:hypothetical protein
MQEEYSFSHPYTHSSCADGGASKVSLVELAQPNSNPTEIKTSNLLMTFTLYHLPHPIPATKARFTTRERELSMHPVFPHLWRPLARRADASERRELGGGGVGNTKLMRLFGRSNLYGDS